MNSERTADQRNLVEELAEEYASRVRRGDSVDIDDYIREHPGLAQDIRELFPIVAMLNHAAEDSQQTVVGTQGDQREPAGADQDSGHVIGPGSLLGDYCLVQLIGRGGMGVVYQAEHVVLRHSVAIKLLPSTLTRSSMRERFLREASAAARMNHPNIVRVFDFGSCGDTLYYAMPLVEGCGLNELMSSRATTEISRTDDSGDHQKSLLPFAAHPGPTTATDDLAGSTQINRNHTHVAASSRTPKSLWAWVADLGAQAADALAYAHEIGVIHRDIKPGNLMLDLNGKLFVMDFGLAKIATDNSLTGTGDVLGTLRYMPPEAFEGNSDERGDIYGLGLTLYELLTGEPTFRNRDRGQLIRDITSGNLRRLSKRVPQAPRDLEKIIHKAVATDPADRYRTASDMRDDLKRYLNGQPVSVRQPSLTYRVSRWVNRNRLVTVLTSGLILLLASVAFMAIRNSGRYRQLADDATRSESQARRNLLTARLSDARGWATSRRPGQRVEGFASLRHAISLAREMGVLDQHLDEIQEIAVTLSTLNDVPPGDNWRHVSTVHSYDPMAFNSTLSRYAVCSQSDGKYECGVFSTVGGKPRLIETIPVPYRLTFALKFSPDERFLIGVPTDKHNPIWIYDRQEEVTLTHSVRSTGARGVAFLDSQQIAVVSDSNLKLVSLPECSVHRELPLPASVRWNSVVLSPDGEHAVLYLSNTANAVLLSLGDARAETVEVDGPVRHAAWRPDGRQIAFATNEVLVWDVQRRAICNRWPHTHNRTTHIRYSGDGRMLLTSGWNHVTQFFDPLSERQVMRCESLLLAISADGMRIVMHSGSRFERRRLVSSRVISEFRYSATGEKLVHPPCVDAKTGTAWVNPPNRIVPIDILNNRLLADLEDEHETAQAAVDPESREVFFCVQDGLLRLPITNPEPDVFQIGPPEPIEVPSSSVHGSVRPHSVRFDSDGGTIGLTMDDTNCQIVMHRSQGWSGTHQHGRPIPVDLAVNSKRPLMATSTHHSEDVEVRDARADAVVFSLKQRQCNTAFSADGSRLFVGADARIRAYNVDTWEVEAETDPVDWFDAGVKFTVSNDGRWVAADLRNPRGVVVLDARTLRAALRFGSNHMEPESRVGHFDSTGRWLVSERGMGVIAVWDLAALRLEFQELGLEWPLGELGTHGAETEVARDVRLVLDRGPN